MPLGRRSKCSRTKAISFFFADFACTEGIDGNRSRFGNADGVGNLDLALGCQTGGYDVFCNIAAGVSGGTVHFGRVFAGECAAAVRSRTAVGIDDDFTAGQTAVALRPPITKRPVGLIRYLVSSVSSSDGRTGLMMCSITAFFSSS